MKIGIFGIFAVSLAALPAVANPCGPRPVPAQMIDGGTADRNAMQRSDQQLIGYTRQVNRYLACLSAEEKATRDEAKAEQQAYERQVSAFNDRITAAARS